MKDCKHLSLERHEYYGAEWWQCENGCDFVLSQGCWSEPLTKGTLKLLAGNFAYELLRETLRDVLRHCVAHRRWEEKAGHPFDELVSFIRTQASGALAVTENVKGSVQEQVANMVEDLVEQSLQTGSKQPEWPTIVWHIRAFSPQLNLPRCHAASDGECTWKHCPQLREGEPKKTGRHCPLDWLDEEE